MSASERGRRFNWDPELLSDSKFCSRRREGAPRERGGEKKGSVLFSDGGGREEVGEEEKE
jgi:hypothetical protein